MRPADRAEFLKVINGLAAIKPGAKITPEALDIWWMSMQDWSLAQFKAAAAHLSRSIEFMPSPYHFDQLRKADRPTAGEAWIKAKAACGTANQCGRFTNNGTCGDVLIDRVVQAIGGYGVIASCEIDKLTFLERRFAEHYESLQDTEDVREALPQLMQERPPRRLHGPHRAADCLVRITRETN